MLCCDGVFEGAFANEQVVEFILEEMKTCKDLGLIAGKVCEEAIFRGSKDNISCMIVMFAEGTEFVAEFGEHVFIPGPYACPDNRGFVTAYGKILDHACYTLPKGYGSALRLCKANLTPKLERHLLHG